MSNIREFVAVRSMGITVSSIRDFLNDRVAERRYCIERRQFIDALGDGSELKCLLEALDATRAQLDAWPLSPLASAELLDRMMMRAKITALDRAANPTLVKEAQAACRACTVWKQCRRWLAHDLESGLYRGCPNAALFERMRQST